MPRKSPPRSTLLRSMLRERIRNRVADLGWSQREAAEAMGFTRSQMSRLIADEDLFSLDRLVDAAHGIGLATRMTATRPWGGK